ncbi:hypothetical protein GCM10019059_37910 [Camelimonas fluminis]|uniref:Phage protein (TIGR02220 family) n=1 Tax=Camelimonas fluminis TaxID=1576911 RepID=A0ABV7UP08_9HYPH|nr:hypothetical protein [Camelimonas fluminis]GHE74780.1 hypothetical protein GCM10019059_37910 [Camelimonas fluminis]
MARIRSVHPGIFTDEAFMSVSVEARLLLIGVWTEAYDDGVFDWKPLTLKARIFPVNDADVPALLGELVDAGIVARFDSGEKAYGAVRNFQKFQRPKKPNSSGVLPDRFRGFVGASSGSSEPVPNQSATGGEKSLQMEDGGGNRRIEDTASAASSSRAGLSYDQIESQCRKAAGLENDPSPSLLDLSPINQLLAKGADLERDIVPVIRAKARPGVRSWRFFVPAIVEAMTPAASLSGIKPSAPPIPDEDRWASSLRSHARGIWSDHWGPEPGKPGCRIPDAFVAKWRRDNGKDLAA